MVCVHPDNLICGRVVMSDNKVKIFHGVTCLGCDTPDTLCLEIGMTESQTLACEECITKFFERTRRAILNSN